MGDAESKKGTSVEEGSATKVISETDSSEKLNGGWDFRLSRVRLEIDDEQGAVHTPSLRPSKFDEYVGQSLVEDNLLIASRAAARGARRRLTMYCFMARPA